MSIRLLAVLALTAAIAAIPAAPAVGSSRVSNRDGQLVQVAASRLDYHPPTWVARWLARRPGVTRAAIAGDGETLNVRFRDGQEISILRRAVQPRRHVLRPLESSSLRALAAPRALSGPARALVLEPFADSFGVSAGQDPVIDVLRAAGFQVDIAFDNAVTVRTMDNLSQYNVVFINTHSGITSSGLAEIATRQQSDCSPPYRNSDDSVEKVGVAGSSLCYYAITSRFVADLAQPFAPDSLLFLSGCSLLGSDPFWDVLSGRGVGAEVSWTADVLPPDAIATANAFFSRLDQGSTLDGALTSIQAGGLGVSWFQGQRASLGIRGDGSITLGVAADPPPATPTPVRTDTPQPPSPTATSTPTLTATPAPTATPSPTPAPSEPVTTRGLRGLPLPV